MSWSSCPGGAAKLGFALLLRFYAMHGRFPAGRGEIPDQTVAHVARLADVPGVEGTTEQPLAVRMILKLLAPAAWQPFG